ncbi:hypothetical protein [Kitasatospora sp. P5_F3]
MSDAPTVVEVTTAPLSNTPAAPRTNPSAGSLVPGMPLAVAAANAAAGIASGAVVAGGPISLAVAGVAAGAAAGAAVLRRRAGRTRAHQAIRAANAGHLARTAARHAAPTTAYGPASAGRRTTAPHVPGQQARTATGRRSTAGGPARSTTALGQTATIPPRPSHRPTVGSHNQAPAYGGSSQKDRQRQGGRVPSIRPGGYSGGQRPGWMARSLDKARPSGGPLSPGGADKRQERRVGRTDARLAKGLARAERRTGITPTTSLKNTAKDAKSPSPDGLNAEQHKRLKRSAGRFKARMGGAVLATAGAGLASALVGNWRHRGLVSSHVRRTWARLLSGARAARDRRDAAILGTGQGADSTGKAAVPVPATKVNWPASHRPTTERASAAPGAAVVPASPISLGKSTVKESTVSDSESTVPAFSLSSAADVLLQAAASFDPEQMSEFEQLVIDLPTAYATLQEALRVLTELTMERLPVEPVVVEEIGEGYRAMSRVVLALEEVAPAYRRAHQVDIDRVENPRNGLDAERKWNV